MDRRLLTLLALAGSLTSLGLTATPIDAQTATPAVLAATCNNCHGPDGLSPGAMPSLDKLDTATMIDKLKGFRSGTLEATVMARIAKGYTDAEIDALGKSFASISR